MKRLSFLLLYALLLITCLNKQPKKQVNVKNPYWDKAIAYRDLGQIKTSFLYFNRAKDIFLIQKDSLNAGKCLVNMGIFATNMGDYYGGQEISISAIPCFDPKNNEHKGYVSSNLNNIGLASYRLKEYGNALKFYNEVLRLSNNPLHKFICLNNIAKVYEEQKKYNEAITIYDEVLRNTADNAQVYARALGNISFTKWLQNPSYNAVPGLLQSLRIREKENDQEGLNYCYARLADYHSEKNPVLAQSYAYKMYAVAKINNYPYDQLEALYKLVKLSHSVESKRYFQIYERLDDSLQTARATAKNQFALIRYETEKHKADKLILQKDNTEKKYQLIKQKAVLLSTIALLVLGTIFSIYWYKKRKKALQKEKELEVKNTELKYVKKVHDRVANKVYSVMMEVENTDNFNKTTLADKLETIYKISRDISYESNDIDTRQVFAQQLHQLLMSYNSDVIGISINGNHENLWQDADEVVKSEIIIVLQELMTNMMKHSKATTVQLDFRRVDNWIHIVYLDNGIGIVGELIFKNGLTNTGNRIEEINGVINFDITVLKGLKIEISFPVF